MGNFDEAQQVLESCDKRLRGKKTKTKMSDALGEEIADAQSRMRSWSLWEGSGRAEVRDSMQMYSMQRSTTLAVSSSAAARKSCQGKAMFLTRRSSDWVSKSRE